MGGGGQWSVEGKWGNGSFVQARPQPTYFFIPIVCAVRLTDGAPSFQGQPVSALEAAAEQGKCAHAELYSLFIEATEPA